MRSAPVDPISDPAAWDTVTVAGVPSPGICTLSGFDRQTEWDIKKSKGLRGASLVLVQIPLAKGSIKFVLWTSAHFQIWRDTFRKLFEYSPTKKAQAIDLYHPSLVPLGIRAVVVAKLGREQMVSPGRYEIDVEFIEYLPPPKKSITASIDKSKADTSKAGKTSSKENPIISAKEAEARRLLEQINPPLIGPPRA